MIAFRTCQTICIIAGVNASTCFVASMILGGEAHFGKIEDGRYFLGSHAGDVAGGRLVEVSSDVYHYSLWHLRSMVATSVAGIAAGLLAKSSESEG